MNRHFLRMTAPRTQRAGERNRIHSLRETEPGLDRVLHPQGSLWLVWFESWTLPVWSLGVLVFAARLALGYKHAFTLGRRGRPAGESVAAVVARLKRAMGVNRPIRVLMSSISDSPSVVGWLRPVILLPAATLMGLTPLQLEAVLAHEIGHIKRYDYLVNMLQMLVEALLFYHPAVWWTSNRIRLERELCCDDLAVRFSGNALRYARALMVLEKLRLRTPSVAMASTGGPLLYRIQRLAGVTAREYGPSRLPAVLAMSLGVLCFALNIGWLRGQDAPGVKVDLGSSPAALESVLKWHFTRDAARGTRQITISFSEEGRHVQVREPQVAKVITSAGTERELELKNFVELAKAQLIEAQRSAEASGLLANRQNLEREIAALRNKLKENPGPAPEAGEIAKKLERLRTEFEAMPLPVKKAGPAVMAGRAIKQINVGELPDSVRDELLSQLPVREGDTLSQDSIEQVAKALRSFDEHLAIQFRATGDGQVELRIIVPGDRR